MKWVGWDHLDVLKMDCEGCEYALARDILKEDPGMYSVLARCINILCRILFRNRSSCF